jgi:hypothetical protein
MKTADTRTLEAAARALKQTTGIDPAIEYGTLGPENPAATVDIPVGRRRHRFRAAIKVVDRFATPALIRSEDKNGREPVLLVAPFVSREVAERCRELHLPFIDTAGNAYLEAPGLFLYVVGQPRPVERHDIEFRAMTAAGLQIAFAFLCRPALIRAPYREIAARAGVALGTIGPVLKDLEARGYVCFNKRQERKLIDAGRMVEEWVVHYPAALRAKLNARRFQADPARLQQIDLSRQRAFWGGEPAAEQLTHYLKPLRFTIYARELIAPLVAAGRMRSDSAGNVEILDTFWNFESEADTPGVVPPLLAYADLLATNDGRNVEAARMIYEQRIAPAFNQAG